MKIAAIQAAPVYLDKEATTEKILALMREASGNGAELCAFPETFLSGYVVWPDITGGAKWNDAQQKEAYAAYVAGSVATDGPERESVATQARELGIFTYLGFIERSASGGSVYCALAAIHPEQGIVSVHRKLMPTYHERMVWSQGDAHGLQVHDLNGFRVGGLNCWENWMPLARYTMYAQGEQLHISTWPGAPWLTRDITRFIAMEGRVYAMAVGGVLTTNDIPDAFPLKNDLLEARDRYLSGGTMIVAPDGQTIEGPIEDDETILYADIDVSKVLEERQNFDPAGHYARQDIFDLKVNRRRLDPISED